MTLDTVPTATAQTGIRVAVFDRRSLVADGFAALLAQDGRVEIVGVGTSVHAAARLLASTPVDVVVVGIGARDVKATARMLDRIGHEQWAQGPRMVGIVSGDQDVADLIGSPGVAIITTWTDTETLHDVVVSTRPGGIVAVPPMVIWPPAEPERSARSVHPDLTPRELQVLHDIESGLSTTEIAQDLGIAPNTVRTHAQRLMSKLSVHSRVQAAAISAGEDGASWGG